ncbi:MAG: helix-turn-helix domain-containing protein [Dehalococcoidales bacterium]|nr:helix-turn-helix domain-containing protein [Dehalococcoidales bacterium]
MEIRMRTDDVLSIDDAAQELGIDRATVYRRLAKGTMISVRFGGAQYIPKSEIERLKKEDKAEET